MACAVMGFCIPAGRRKPAAARCNSACRSATLTSRSSSATQSGKGGTAGHPLGCWCGNVASVGLVAQLTARAGHGRSLRESAGRHPPRQSAPVADHAPPLASSRTMQHPVPIHPLIGHSQESRAAPGQNPSRQARHRELRNRSRESDTNRLPAKGQCAPPLALLMAPQAWRGLRPSQVDPWAEG
jgi:hypothetical protein